MMKKLLTLLLAMAPLAATAHGLHSEPVPTVYYTPESAYYVDDRVATNHVVQQQSGCGCCGCAVANPDPLPAPPVIIRSVMPVITECAMAHHDLGHTRHMDPAPMPCGHACHQAHEVHHADQAPSW